MNSFRQQQNQGANSRSRRQIYIASIGKSNTKQISCHINQDTKSLKYEPKQTHSFNALQQIFINLQRQAFNKILRFSSFKRQRGETVFLPEALLHNNLQVITDFKQKLISGPLDRYIKLHYPARQSKSPGFKKTGFTSFFKAKEDADSTFVQKKYKTIDISKSIDVTRIKKNVKKDITIFQIDMTHRKNASRSKSNILNITYTEVKGDYIKSPLIKSENKNKPNNHKHITVRQFELQGYRQGKRESRQKVRQVKPKTKYSPCQDSPCNQTKQFTRSAMRLDVEKIQFDSPFIGKNRQKNSSIGNFSAGKFFESIQIKYQLGEKNLKDETLRRR